MVVAALLTERLPQDCRICRRVPRLREQWGCDESACDPTGYVHCHRCYGRDPECPECEGDQRGIPVYDCPYRTAAPTVLRALPFYANWRNGLLPVPGGLLDQSASFVDAMRMLDSEVAEAERVASEKARKQSETVNWRPVGGG